MGTGITGAGTTAATGAGIIGIGDGVTTTGTTGTGEALGGLRAFVSGIRVSS
jgi:hypothetical protein